MNLQGVLGSLYSFTQDAILVFEATSDSSSTPRIAFANQPFLALAGFAREEIIGRDLSLVEGPDTDPTAITDISKHIADRSPYRTQVKHYRKDGTPYWVDLSLFPVDDPDSGHRCMVSVQRDMTAFRVRQEALDAAEAKRQSALQASNARSRFLANMSHELRTPMNGVIGVTELLLETKLNADQQKYAHTIMSSAESLLGLLNDILDYSKIEAGKLEIDSVPVDMLVLIEDVVDLLAVRASDREVDLLVQYPEDVPRFLIGDPLRLRQILFNLVGNAVKFSESGHVLISITQDDDGMINISVEDTGVGIPEDKLTAIFRQFSQVDVSTTRKFGGTGLGLAISQSLVGLMGGGSIAVESTLGKGSTFSFKIRTVLDKNAVAPPFHDKPLTGQRALIVDDEDLNCRIFKEMLESTGLTCVTVQSGTEALEALRKAHAEGPPFDVVLLDFSMPMMNGEQTAMAIKVVPDFSDTILVMISAADETRDQARLERAGLAAWLTKPVRREQLGSLVGSLLKAKRLGGSNQPTIDAKAVQGRPGSVLCRADTVNCRPDAQALEGLEVLLVEDNRINQKVAAERLKGLACQVTIAENGREAVEKVQSNAFDLILMDCQMPEMDGYEATQKIRQLSAAGKIAPLPIIALTANAMAGDRDKCLSAGMDDYMSKPVRKENLMAALSTWAPPKKAKPSIECLPEAVANPSRDLPSFPTVASTSTITCVPSACAAVTDAVVDAAPTANGYQGAATVSAPSQPDGRDPAAAHAGWSPQETDASAQASNPPTCAPSRPSHADTAVDGGIDNEILDGIRESMGDQFGVILQYYLEDATDCIATIECSGADDVKAIVAPAHMLKSSSREIGAMRVFEIAQQIEQLARQATEADVDPTPIVPLIQDLGPAFEQAKAQLQHAMN